MTPCIRRFEGSGAGSAPVARRGMHAGPYRTGPPRRVTAGNGAVMRRRWELRDGRSDQMRQRRPGTARNHGPGGLPVNRRRPGGHQGGGRHRGLLAAAAVATGGVAAINGRRRRRRRRAFCAGRMAVRLACVRLIGVSMARVGVDGRRAAVAGGHPWCGCAMARPRRCGLRGLQARQRGAGVRHLHPGSRRRLARSVKDQSDDQHYPQEDAKGRHANTLLRTHGRFCARP